MTKTNTAADKIRTALKTAGFNSRKVTVKEPHWGSVKVTIRDASIGIGAVKAVAGAFENVRRCQTTGEILCGGNTYVDVSYHESVTAILATEIEERILAGRFTLPNGAQVEADDVSRPHDTKVWKMVDGVGSMYCMGVRHAANRLAVELLDAGVVTLEPMTVAA